MADCVHPGQHWPDQAAAGDSRTIETSRYQLGGIWFVVRQPMGLDRDRALAAARQIGAAPAGKISSIKARPDHRGQSRQRLGIGLLGTAVTLFWLWSLAPPPV